LEQSLPLFSLALVVQDISEAQVLVHSSPAVTVLMFPANCGLQLVVFSSFRIMTEVGKMGQSIRLSGGTTIPERNSVIKQRILISCLINTKKQLTYFLLTLAAFTRQTMFLYIKAAFACCNSS